VLGYELFNEPSAGTLFLACMAPAGCPTFDSQLTTFNQRVAAAIRGVDRRTLIFYEPDVSFDFGVNTHVGALSAGPTGFAFHDYCLSASPNGCASETQPFANAVARAGTTHDALLLDEFGANPNPGDLTHMTGLADQYMVPWVEWAYCGCGDPTTSGPGDQQAFVRNPARPPRGANLRQPTYPVLVEPFPHLIAGTPLSWGYNAQTKTFRLTYATARASGHGRFGRGAITQIATPAVVYGRRYAVHVQGGAIVSRPGAGTLKIAGCRGAGRITVTVLAHGRNRESCRR
jgi:endoglycosylceramidase